MAGWDISETLMLVEAKFGKPQRDKANASIQSACQRRWYAHFHFHEIKGELERFQASHLSDQSLIEIAWSADDDVRSEYHEFMDRVGAHAVACVQSIHAMADLLANAAFFSLALKGQKPVLDHEVNCALTVRLLKGDARYNSIRKLMQTLSKDRSYRHVAALSNQAKHSSIVKPLLNEDMTGRRAERHEIRFDAFTTKGKPYPQAKMDDVLTPAYALASKTLVDIGNAISQALK